AFGPGGRTARTLAENTIETWGIPQPLLEETARIRLWVQVITGMRQDSEGDIEWLNDQEGQEGLRGLQARGGAPVCSEPTMKGPREERRQRLLPSGGNDMDADKDGDKEIPLKVP